MSEPTKYPTLKDAEKSKPGTIFMCEEDGEVYVHQSYGMYKIPQQDVCPCCGTLVYKSQIKKNYVAE